MRPDLRAEVGARLRTLRKAAKYSQEDLAEHAGLHRNYVGLVERGEQDIALGSLVKLLHALDSSLAEFFAPFTARRPKR